MEEAGKELAKGLGELLPEIYRDGPKEGWRQMWLSLGDILTMAFQRTLPIRLNNLKRDLEYKRNAKELRESFAKIPQEKVIEVAPELSMPALDKLSYASNEKIAKLFINLLATAANSDTAQMAHPAFVQMIERLSADEAKIILSLKGEIIILYVGIRVNANEGETFYYVESDHLTNLILLDLDFPANLPIYLSNLVSMGVLVDNKGKQLSDKIKYDELKVLYQDRYYNDLQLFKDEHPECSADWIPSYFDITQFGQTFINTCTQSDDQWNYIQSIQDNQ